MCMYCKCGKKMIPFDELPKELQKKLNPENDPYKYEYCCFCPDYDGTASEETEKHDCCCDCD